MTAKKFIPNLMSSSCHCINHESRYKSSATLYDMYDIIFSNHFLHTKCNGKETHYYALRERGWKRMPALYHVTPTAQAVYTLPNPLSFNAKEWVTSTNETLYNNSRMLIEVT